MKKEIIQTDGKTVKATVQVFIIKEGDYYVSYCPALEVSSYAKSSKDAKKRFEEALDIFFEETIKAGTFEKELLKLGWILPSHKTLKL
jgi:predicted RNase H-like HicB family nuclease